VPLYQNYFPDKAFRAVRKLGVTPTPNVLTVNVAEQRMILWKRGVCQHPAASFPCYTACRNYIISTSAYGIGQAANSNQTPIGWHRIAKKIGGGQPIGTVFRSRQPVGYTWQGIPQGLIVHRIFWLEGLQPGLNRGGNVDTLRRYIYIHGFWDETTLGRPQSHGCIHLAAADLIPLFDLLPEGTLVWIGEK